MEIIDATGVTEKLNLVYSKFKNDTDALLIQKVNLEKHFRSDKW